MLAGCQARTTTACGERPASRRGQTAGKGTRIVHHMEHPTELEGVLSILKLGECIISVPRARLHIPSPPGECQEASCTPSHNLALQVRGEPYEQGAHCWPACNPVEPRHAYLSLHFARTGHFCRAPVQWDAYATCHNSSIKAKQGMHWTVGNLLVCSRYTHIR